MTRTYKTDIPGALGIVFPNEPFYEQSYGRRTLRWYDIEETAVGLSARGKCAYESPYRNKQRMFRSALLLAVNAANMQDEPEAGEDFAQFGESEKFHFLPRLQYPTEEISTPINQFQAIRRSVDEDGFLDEFQRRKDGLAYVLSRVSVQLIALRREDVAPIHQRQLWAK